MEGRNDDDNDMSDGPKLFKGDSDNRNMDTAAVRNDKNHLIETFRRQNWDDPIANENGALKRRNTGERFRHSQTETIYHDETNKLKRSHDDMDCIRVAVRVRPLLDVEKNRNMQMVVECGQKNQMKEDLIDDYITVRYSTERNVKCKFDYVYGPEVSQAQLYYHVQECVARVVEGYNSTVMTYGQTGSGKTYTMFGAKGSYSPDLKKGGQLPVSAGIIPRAIAQIFSELRQQTSQSNCEKVAVYCSFIQIYNEQLYDMLRDARRANPLSIHEDSNQEIYVQGLSEFRVRNVSDCITLLRLGENNRAVRETYMNQSSSRSHSIFQIVIERPYDDGGAALNSIHRSKLNLIDLAGSEKWDITQNIVGTYAQELNNINSSLFTLGRCITALCSSQKTSVNHIPYRESKLTRLIQDSLGGNTITYLVATLSPTAESVHETISTLKFADNARKVMTFVPAEETHQSLIKRLKNEVVNLRAIILKSKTQRHADNREEQNRIIGSLELELEKEKKESERFCVALRKLQQEKQQQQQQEETDARSQCSNMASPVFSSSTSDTMPVKLMNDPRRDETLSMQYDSLRSKFVAADKLNRKFTQLLSDFFAFKIEEIDLRHSLVGIVPNSDEFIFNNDAYLAAPTISEEQATVTEAAVTSPIPNCYTCSRKHRHTCGVVPASEEVVNGRGTPQPTSTSWHLDHPFPETQISAVFDAPDALHLYPHPVSQSLDRYPYGKAPLARQYQRKLELPSISKEEQLIRKMTEARRKIQRQIQLQNWLIAKDQRELHILQKEEEGWRTAERIKKEKNRLYYQRAQALKQKLRAYYSEDDRADKSQSSLPTSLAKAY